jgi:hypothetical protein
VSLDLPQPAESPISPAQQSAAEAAFQVETRIKESIRRMRALWVDLARDLFMFEQSRLWAELGHSSFGAWMADPDIGIEAGWGYHLTSIYRELVAKRGVDPERLKDIEPSKVQVVLPAVRRGHDLEEALADAESLGRDDLRERYHGNASRRTAAGSMPDSTTAYDSESERPLRHCSTCGQVIRT